MKKLLFVGLLMLALVFTVVACTTEKDPVDTNADTTAASDVTKAPEESTKAPDATTQAPEETTEAPEQPTEAPEQPTDAPAVTTEEPETETHEPEEEIKLATDKTEYFVGEDILVTANGSAYDWVGLYLEDDIADATAEGGVGSIYWYYVAAGDYVPGTAVNIRNTESNRSDYADIPAGQYKLILFKDNGYEVLAEVHITVKIKPYYTAEEAGKKAASFDTFYVNNEMYFEADGGAGDKLTAQDNIVAFKPGEAHESMMLRGWIGFDQAIESFGYFVDDNTVFFLDAANIKETEDAVKGAGGEFAVRFEIPVPLADLTEGDHTVGFVAKLADGTMVLLRDCLTISIKPLPSAEDAGKKNNSFDTFYVNNEMYFEQDGGAGDKLTAQNDTIGFDVGDAHESMVLRGWIGFDQAIDTFGYFVDSYSFVFNADYTKPTEDAVKGAGGEFALRFEIAVPLADLNPGKHIVGFVVKLADGTVVRLRHDITVIIVPPHIDETVVLGERGEGGPYSGSDKKFGQRYNIGENFLKNISIIGLATYADGNVNKWSLKVWAWNTDYETTVAANPLYVVNGENHSDNTTLSVDIPAKLGITGEFYYEIEYLEGAKQFTGWTAAKFVAEGVETYVSGALKDGTYASTITVGVAEEPSDENVIKVTTTDTYDWNDPDCYTFTATAAGTYVFSIPAGLGFSSYDGWNNWEAPEVDFYDNADGATVSVTLAAGAEYKFCIAAETKADWVITYTFTEGEAGGDEGGEGGDEPAPSTELAIGVNTIPVTAADLDAGAIAYTFTVTDAGMYTFKSNDLMAQIYDADGNMIARGMSYLKPGVYTIQVVVAFVSAPGNYSITVEYEAVDENGYKTETAYKFYTVQGKLESTPTLYLDGGVSTRYLTTTTDITKAIDVYLEAAEGGYKIYTLVDDAKQYVEVYLNDSSKVSVRYNADANCVFTYNADTYAWETTLDGVDYYLGTFNTYETISASKTSFINAENTRVSQFPLELVLSE